MEGLPPPDRRVVQKALASLPPRLEEAKQKEMGEMMGKLKEVGRSFSSLGRGARVADVR